MYLTVALQTGWKPQPQLSEIGSQSYNMATRCFWHVICVLRRLSTLKIDHTMSNKPQMSPIYEIGYRNNIYVSKREYWTSLLCIQRLFFEGLIIWSLSWEKCWIISVRYTWEFVILFMHWFFSKLLDLVGKIGPLHPVQINMIYMIY